MWAVVIPAFNESDAIVQVLNTVTECKFDHIILVTNGCTDDTLKLSQNFNTNSNLHILNFYEPLGIDIPRAIGAAFASQFNLEGLVFIDGDMKGDISRVIYQLIYGIKNGLDMTLTNCYPYINLRSDLATSVLKEREKLNRKLGLFNKIGLASPSHGPHAISSNLLNTINPRAIAIPPLSLAMSAKSGFNVGVSASIPHKQLGSSYRNKLHSSLIAQTIIGDCKQAMLYIDNLSVNDTLSNNDFLIGYRILRRYDLLEEYLHVLDLD